MGHRERERERPALGMRWIGRVYEANCENSSLWGSFFLTPTRTGVLDELHANRNLGNSFRPLHEDTEQRVKYLTHTHTHIWPGSLEEKKKKKATTPWQMPLILNHAGERGFLPDQGRTQQQQQQQQQKRQPRQAGVPWDREKDLHDWRHRAASQAPGKNDPETAVFLQSRW